MHDFENMCQTRPQSKSRGRVNSGANENTEEKEYITVPVIVNAVVNKRSTRRTQLVLKDKSYTALIDSGSEINIINLEMFKSLNIPVDSLVKVNEAFVGYGPESERQEIPLMGYFTEMIKCPVTMKQRKTTIFVMNGIGENILSCEDSEKLGLVTFHKVNSVEMKKLIPTEEEKYKECFEKVGKFKDKQIELSINKDIKPVAQKARRIPYHLRNQVESEIERLEKLDIIEKVEGPTPWISPLVIVHKPNNEIRICLDSRVINTAIERERHPMNTIKELIVDLNGSKIFSKIDLNKGYHQLELAESSRYITYFATHSGLYRYKRLCFGINSAAEIFQKTVADMLQGIPGVINMSDDILIYSKTEKEHQMSLTKVMDSLKANGVTANKEKCQFWSDEVTFFGHKFSAEGISPCPKKIEAVLNAEEPANADEVRSLLGMAQYLARFIPNYSTVVAPLSDLTKKGNIWKWEEKEKDAFSILKESMANWQMLKYYDVNLPTELIVDASPKGVAGILVQKYDENKFNVIEYASRKLTDVESRYSQTEREALAVVCTCLEQISK